MFLGDYLRIRLLQDETVLPSLPRSAFRIKAGTVCKVEIYPNGEYMAELAPAHFLNLCILKSYEWV
jgi:hypothetical protein